jgi:hypothetical protein
MRKYMFVSVVLGSLVSASLVPRAAQPAQVGGQPSGLDTEIAKTPDAGSAIAGLKSRSINLDDYIKAATRYGYEPSIIGQPGDRLLVLELTKFGKTANGYGILQKKWDQKDTIDLTFGRQADGFSLESVSRNVQVKPPIGDWIKQPSKDVPAWVLAPSLTSG